MQFLFTNRVITMTTPFLSIKLRKLVQATALLTLATGALQIPALAATLAGPTTVNFGPVVTGNMCSFTGNTGGMLGLSSDKKEISSVTGSGINASLTVATNFNGGTLEASVLTLDSLKGGQVSPASLASSTPILGLVEQTTLNLQTGTSTIPVGVRFISQTPFAPDTYYAFVHVTCTD